MIRIYLSLQWNRDKKDFENEIDALNFRCKQLHKYIVLKTFWGFRLNVLRICWSY